MSNVIRDRMWIRGVSPDDAVYEVALKGTNDITYLHGEAVYRGTVTYEQTGLIVSPTPVPSPYLGTEQISDGVTTIAKGGYKAAYSIAAGTVVQVFDLTSGLTDSQWLYLHQRTTDMFPSSGTWTRQGFTARQQKLDISGNGTTVTATNSLDAPLLYPALGEDGQLVFENQSILEPGRYKLTIETGNLGRPDGDFDGFDVELNLNGNIVQTVLLAGRTDFNARGTDTVDFDIITPAATGSWLLSMLWFNATRDAAKGTMRQLVVYSYYLEKLATELFRIDIVPGDTRCDIVAVSYGGDIPGGWISRVNSYGTVVTVAHEGTIYPQNDTVVSRLPLANMLTGSTNECYEDILVGSVYAVYGTLYSSGTVGADLPELTLPTFGVLIDNKL